MKNTQNHYFVVNYKGELAWHDLDYDHAQACLEAELAEDKDNYEEREIIDENDDED